MSNTQTIHHTFTIPFKNLRFHYGGVSCKKLVKELDKTVSITIINFDIREEFDAVKEYFANALGKAEVHIKVQIEAVDGVVRKIEAHSPDIEGINQNLIETVRFQYIKDAVKRKVKIETERNVLQMDELLNALSGNKATLAAFYKDEKGLADDLVQIADAKHYYHLRYLSTKHAHHVMRLRFVLKPFSFIFLLEGATHYHVIWETLDTEEATYVWPVEKDPVKLKLTLQKIEDIIQLVKVQGKTAYISSEAQAYRRVFHHYKEEIKGFVKWKGELESGLT